MTRTGTMVIMAMRDVFASGPEESTSATPAHSPAASATAHAICLRFTSTTLSGAAPKGSRVFPPP